MILLQRQPLGSTAAPGARPRGGRGQVEALARRFFELLSARANVGRLPPYGIIHPGHRGGEHGGAGQAGERHQAWPQPRSEPEQAVLFPEASLGTEEEG